MFFTFRQNNSGGVFTSQFHTIIVEADSADEANERAEEHTFVSFDGVSKGRDCECCGDRWGRQWDDEGDDVPSIWGKAVELDTTVPKKKRDTMICFRDGTLVTGKRVSAR
jgi:hypothetical protein